MRTAVLLGNRDTKRTIYFEKAARQNGLPFLFLEWEDWKRCGFPADSQLFVKIDPPVWTDGHLSGLNDLVGSYRSDLKALEKETSVSQFLNPPRALMELLDKTRCKQVLKEAGLPVTQCLGEGIGDSEALLSRMRDMRIFSVFIKPVSGSGAAGVTAFRFQPKTGRMAAYSCAAPDQAALKPDRSSAFRPPLINTKRLHTITEPAEIMDFLDSLLSLGCIVERWYPKADFQGFSYDLRAVCQDGALDFLLARLSKGPVTNLHLNNHPLEASRLALPGDVTSTIQELCRRACGCYPGLRSAGIDILLEKGSLKPRIIEMNGQGDLLYQDIYDKNEIYSHQVRMMKAWLEQGGTL